MYGKLQVQRVPAEESLWIDRAHFEPRERLKMWEMDFFFRCPIVGGCLTVAEQKHLLKKAGVCLKDKNLYDIHEILVSCCESDNPLSRKLDNRLAGKFKKTAARLLAMDQPSFMASWNDCFANGEYREALWVAASKWDLETACRRKIFGEVHMAMHRSLEQRKKAEVKIADLETDQAAARENRKKLTREIKTLQQQIKTLEAETHALQVRLNAAAEMNDRMRQRLNSADKEISTVELERTVLQLRKQTDEYSATISEQKRQIDKLTKENLNTTERYDQLTAVDLQLQNYINSLIGDMKRADTCDESCPAFDLCKKRVLIVGGIGRMETLYRQLIESRGGLLEYHDGNVKGGARQLENRLRRADVILCPVNCNSHAACSLVKNLAKRHGKPVHMMSNFSLNAVSRQINQSSRAVAARN